MNIGKYAFNDKKQFDSKVESINEDIKFAVVEIGLLEETAPTYNEDGEELTPSIMGTDYHCDMAWYGLDDHPYGWKSYSVDIDTEGVHSFAGVNYQSHKF